MNLHLARIVRNHVRSLALSRGRYFSSQNTARELELVKQLRKLTNEGVASCKKALLENNWDLKRAATFILGNQQARSVAFDENKLKYGRIAVSHDERRDRLAAVELRSDCDIVASTPLFESVLRSTAASVLEYLERQPAEYFKNRTQIYTLPLESLDSIPISGSSEDTVGNLLRRTASQFGKPVLAESVYVAHSGEKDVIGTYTHRTSGSSEPGTLVGARLGLASISCESAVGLNRSLLCKLADLLALQAVADGSFESLDAFLANTFLNYEHFNRTLSEIAHSLDLGWKGIGPETTVAQALESVGSSKVAHITLNAIAYINSGKVSILKTTHC